MPLLVAAAAAAAATVVVVVMMPVPRVVPAVPAVVAHPNAEVAAAPRGGERGGVVIVIVVVVVVVEAEAEAEAEDVKAVKAAEAVKAEARASLWASLFASPPSPPAAPPPPPPTLATAASTGRGENSLGLLPVLLHVVR